MKIYCPACNAEIAAENVNLSDRLAKCGFCNNVFDYAPQVPGLSARQEERVFVARPNNFTVERSSFGLRIVRSWFTPKIIFLAFFCLLWNGFMAVWFYIAIKSRIYPMALFGSLHGAVGLAMLYAVAAGCVNKTYIRISNGYINITHGPLPWFGQKNVARQDMEQLYTKESVRPGKQGYSFRYSVQAIANTGSVIELITGLDSSEEALFIEQEIEKYLKIDDQPVRGEVPR